MKKILLCLSFGLFIYACNSPGSASASDEIEVAAKTLRLIDKGTKTFPLDNETSVGPNPRFRSRVDDGIEYLTFATRQNNMIYEFEYETALPTRKIRLAPEGPNQVRLFFAIGYFFHTSDSIFVDSGGLGYYLINGEAEVLKKIGIKPDEPNFDSNCCPISFSNASFFEDNKLYGQQRFSTEDDPETTRFEFGSISLADDSKFRQLLPASAFIPQHEEIWQMEQAKDPWVINFSPYFYSQGGLLYAASPIADTVYVFDREFDLKDKYYAGASGISLADYKSYLLINQMQQVENGYQRVTQTDQPAHFSDLFVSPDGQLVYRVLIESTRGTFNEYSDMELAEVSKASLVVLDRETKTVVRFQLPVEELKILDASNRFMFVNSTGLHIQTKEQENEDELTFRVFGVE